MYEVASAHITKRDTRWMRLALQQAELAKAMGDVPVGAIAVYREEVIGAGFNRKELDQMPTAHAELIALEQAAKNLGTWRLSGVTLYCTLEPCPMCAGVMIQARLSRLVYGAPDIRFGADGTIIDLLRVTEFNHRVDVQSGVLAETSAELLRDFFSSVRKEDE